jgi:hypothetical protein
MQGALALFMTILQTCVRISHTSYSALRIALQGAFPTRTHGRAHPHTQARAHARMHAQAHMHTHAHTHAHTRVRSHLMCMSQSATSSLKYFNKGILFHGQYIPIAQQVTDWLPFSQSPQTVVTLADNGNRVELTQYQNVTSEDAQPVGVVPASLQSYKV